MKADFHFVKQLAICLIVLFTSAVSNAGQQADMAVKHVKQMILSGELLEGTTLRIVAKQGNIANFLGNQLELKERWQKETGTFLDANTMPQSASLNYIKEATLVDLTIARNREYADLVQQKLIEDLTPLSKRFNFNISTDKDLILPKMQGVFNGRQVAIPADGDIAVLYLRKDLIDSPENQQAFQSRYGKALAIPKTWESYQQLVEFFHQPDKHFYGSLEQRDLASGWMFWMLRYASKAYPNQYLFDDDMNPLINSEAGLAATHNYIDTVAFSPKGILESKNNYTFTLPKFLNGQGFSTIITLAGAKLFNLPHSKIKDLYAAVPMPGTRFNSGINRRTTLIYGNNIVIPKGAQNKELAYLFAMWLTDPDISMSALAAKGGFSDPYRHSHFESDQMREVYSGQVLDTVKDDLANTVPAGTGLPGDTEYISTLNKQLHLAAQGLKSPEQALQDVEKAWQTITDRYGRESQKAIWKQVKTLYPGD